MNRTRESFGIAARNAHWAFLGLVVPLLGAILSAAPAHAADPTLQIKSDPDPKAKFADADTEILLRPNVDQSFYFAVAYPASEKKPRKVEVELIVGGNVVAKKELLLKPGDTTAFSFGKPPPPPMPNVKAPLPAFKALAGPPFPFKVRLVSAPAKAGGPAKEQVLSVDRIMVPAEFLRASSAYNYTERTLTVTVTARDTFTGPPCTVELVLPKDRLPDMVRAANQTFTSSIKLEKAGETKTLVVNNLYFKLKKGGNLTGVFYLRVDGYNRAFIIEHDFDKKESDNTGTPFLAPSIRLNAKSKASMGKPYPLPLEVDYAKQQLTEMPKADEVKVEIGLYSDPEMTVQVFKDTKGPSVRDQKLLFALDTDGAVLFRPDVRDWTFKGIETAGIKGVRYLRVRLLDPKGKPILWKNESLLARQPVTFFEGEIPDPAGFLKVPKTGSPGDELSFTVKEDEDFQIVDAYISFADLPPTKIPPDDAANAEKLAKVKDMNGVWIGKLTIPDDEKVEKGKKKSVSLLAKGIYADGTEKTIVAKIAFPLQKAPPVKAGGKIKATVFLQNVKTPFPNASLVLTILEQGKAPRKVGKLAKKTIEPGVFEFDGLDPGKYKVSCKHPTDTKMKGEAEAVVEVNKIAEVSIVVKR